MKAWITALGVLLGLAGCDKSAEKDKADGPVAAPAIEAQTAPSSEPDPQGSSEPQTPKEQVTERAKAAESARNAFADMKLGEKQEMAPGVFMTMHQANAENPVDGGWHRGTSTQGAFSIELPLPFNDFRITGPASDGGDLDTDTLGAKTPGLLAYSATCITSPVAFPDGQCGKTLGKIGDAAEVPEARGDMSGFEAETDKAHGQCWIDESAKRTCFLIIETQGEDAMPDPKDRRRFFDSFDPTVEPADGE